MENRPGAICQAGDAVRLLSPAKANDNTTFVIAGRLLAAFPPVRLCKTWAKTGSLRFHAELQTALALSPAFVRSEVQQRAEPARGNAKVAVRRRGEQFFGRLVKIKNCIMLYFQ